MYALYLDFSRPEFRCTSKVISPLKDYRSHVFIWNWVQKFTPQSIYSRMRTSAFIIGETSF